MGGSEDCKIYKNWPEKRLLVPFTQFSRLITKFSGLLPDSHFKGFAAIDMISNNIRAIKNLRFPSKFSFTTLIHDTHAWRLANHNTSSPYRANERAVNPHDYFLVFEKLGIDQPRMLELKLLSMFEQI